MKRKLRADKNFVSCLINEKDELFATGIFEFNITKMLKHIQSNPNDFTLEDVAVSNIPSYSPIEPSKLDSIQVGAPIILAEIAPGQFSLIDGHHRMEKARKTGIQSVKAYWLYMDQHIRFLTDRKAYVEYIEYWNSKLTAC